MFKNKILFLLLVATSFLQATITYDLSAPTEQQIALQKENILTYLSRNTKMRYAAYGAAGISTVYLSYKAGQSLGFWSSKVVDQRLIGAGLVQIIQRSGLKPVDFDRITKMDESPKLAEVVDAYDGTNLPTSQKGWFDSLRGIFSSKEEAIVGNVEVAPVAVSPISSADQGWVSRGKGFLGSAFHLGLGNAFGGIMLAVLPKPILGFFHHMSYNLEKGLDRIFHPVEITWYCNNKTAVHTLFDEIERLSMFPMAAKNAEDRQKAEAAFVQTFQLLLRDFSKVVAFMEIQVDRNSEENPIVSGSLRFATDNTKQLLDKFVTDAKQALQNKDELFVLVQKYREQLRSVQHTFVVYESAASAE